MDIIAFFRGIDGILYYVLLAVNTILIFAIIGYLGEKNNQKIIKIGLSSPTPNNNGAMDFSASVTHTHNNIAMPTVSPTVAPNPSSVAVNSVSNLDVAPNGGQQAMPIAVNPISTTNNEGETGTMNQSAISNVSNQAQVKNEIDPNEKAPAVLVINSQNTNMPK